MKPRNSIFYWIQYLNIFFVLDIQEYIHTIWTSRNIVLAGEAGRHVVHVGVLDLFMDDFLEVQNRRYGQILYLIDYIAYELH